MQKNKLKFEAPGSKFSSTSNLGLRTLNFFVLIWQDTKEIFETFRKIREIIETHLIGNFADRCSFSGYELCSALKPEIPDKFVYGLVGKGLNFTKQIFAAHSNLFRKPLDRKLWVR